eukprot:2377424-Pyramimonas_sp.AAC.1
MDATSTNRSAPEGDFVRAIVENGKLSRSLNLTSPHAMDRHVVHRAPGYVVIACIEAANVCHRD